MRLTYIIIDNLGLSLRAIRELQETKVTSQVVLHPCDTT